MSGGRTSRCHQDIIAIIQGKVYQFPFEMSTCVLRKDLNLIQIRYEGQVFTLILVLESIQTVHVHINLIGQVRYHDTIVKNNRCICSSSEQNLQWCKMGWSYFSVGKWTAKAPFSSIGSFRLGYPDSLGTYIFSMHSL